MKTNKDLLEASQISEGNKLIAEFMGVESYEANGYVNFIYSDDNHRTHVDLAYHSSWDWLMPVVEKIHAEGDFDDYYADDLLHNEMTQAMGMADIKALWGYVIEFIDWYNHLTK
jgi:hypothetical protein